MPNFNPPVPERENPAAVVAAVVLVAGNFEPKVKPVDVVVVAVEATVVFANPDNEPNRGAAEVLAGAAKPRERPVPAALAAVVAAAGWIVPPRVNPPEEVVVGAAPRGNPEPGGPAAPLPPRVSPVEADVAGVVAPPNENAGAGVTVAAAVDLLAPNVKPCVGADAVKPLAPGFVAPCAEPKSPAG